MVTPSGFLALSWVMVPAITQTIVLLLTLPTFRRYPCFFLSLLSWLPVLWIPATFWEGHLPDPHYYWELHIWMPCVALFTLLQSLAGMEAFFRYCPRPALVVRTSISLWSMGLICAARFAELPAGDSRFQVAQVALYGRIITAVALIASIALFWAFSRSWDLLARWEGRHIVLLTLWTWTWALPSIRIWSLPILRWEERLDEGTILRVRGGLLIAWVLAVAIKWIDVPRYFRLVGLRGQSALRSGQGSPATICTPRSSQ